MLRQINSMPTAKMPVCSNPDAHAWMRWKLWNGGDAGPDEQHQEDADRAKALQEGAEVEAGTAGVSPLVVAVVMGLPLRVWCRPA